MRRTKLEACKQLGGQIRASSQLLVEADLATLTRSPRLVPPTWRLCPRMSSHTGGAACAQAYLLSAASVVVQSTGNDPNVLRGTHTSLFLLDTTRSSPVLSPGIRL